jgi:hypothetical protein
MVAHTNGGNSIPRKDRWTLAISILALLMSVNRRRGLTNARCPMSTMDGCSNLQILIEKCR